MKKALAILALGGLAFAGYVVFVYFQLPTAKNINGCFKTAMYGVPLCPKKAPYVSIKSVPKHLIDALIMSEDASFFSHEGFDWYEIKESFRRNWQEGRFARGGSTITQQLAKNLYLSKEKSISRKIKEFILAKRIESRVSKRVILEKYLNVVEFAPKVYGIRAASGHFFAKSPGNLSLQESVYLISLLPSPKRLSRSLAKRKLSSNNLYRMKTILRRLYRSGRLDEESYDQHKEHIETYDWPFEVEMMPTFPFDEEDDEIDASFDDSDQTKNDTPDETAGTDRSIEHQINLDESYSPDIHGSEEKELEDFEPIEE